MELLISIFDFLFGFLWLPWRKVSSDQKHKRVDKLAFRHYVVLFVIFLVILFYFYG